MNAKFSARIAAVLLSVAAAPGWAQDEMEIEEESQAPVYIDAQAFTNPKPIKMPALRFPQSELNQGIEGWVEVQMMVDPAGKPYEFEVVGTSGTKAFEGEALKGAARMRFNPATLGGQAVDAAIVLPVYFVTHKGVGASSEFIRAYRAFGKAIEEKNQAAAEAILNKLTPRNIYESAFFGAAQYLYAERWGSEVEQIAGLRRAIGRMAKPRYLEKKFFTMALQRLFVLEVRTRDYASALMTYKTWIAQRPDADEVVRMRSVEEQVQALRSSLGSYGVPGRMHDGKWSYRLFKNKFRFNVTSGRISQIKLYCQNKYVLFPFDPALQYTIEHGFGKCSMIAYGDGGTEFELSQS